MTGWHPELAVVAVGQAHVYLVPDNGSLSRIHTVPFDPAGGDRSCRHALTVAALQQLFRGADVPIPDDVQDLARSLWARLDRRKKPAPPV